MIENVTPGRKQKLIFLRTTLIVELIFVQQKHSGGIHNYNVCMTP